MIKLNKVHSVTHVLIMADQGFNQWEKTLHMLRLLLLDETSFGHREKMEPDTL